MENSLTEAPSASSASSGPNVLPTISQPLVAKASACKKPRKDTPVQVEATLEPLPLDETEEPVPPDPSESERFPSPLKATTKSKPATDHHAALLPQGLPTGSASTVEVEPAGTEVRPHATEMPRDLERLRKFRRKKNLREAKRKQKKRAARAAASKTGP